MTLNNLGTSTLSRSLNSSVTRLDYELKNIQFYLKKKKGHLEILETWPRRQDSGPRKMSPSKQREFWNSLFFSITNNLRENCVDTRHTVYKCMNICLGSVTQYSITKCLIVFSQVIYLIYFYLFIFVFCLSLDRNKFPRSVVSICCSWLIILAARDLPRYYETKD